MRLRWSQLKYVLTSGVLGSAADGLARLLDTSVVVPLLEALLLLLLLVLAITELKQEGMVVRILGREITSRRSWSW